MRCPEGDSNQVQMTLAFSSRVRVGWLPAPAAIPSHPINPPAAFVRDSSVSDPRPPAGHLRRRPHCPATPSTHSSHLEVPGAATETQEFRGKP